MIKSKKKMKRMIIIMTAKKLIAAGMALFMIAMVFTSCNNKNKNGGTVTLESMKSALTQAGYEIAVDEIPILPENAGGGFTFVYSGAHGKINIPVYEFADEDSAKDYAAFVNTSKSWLAIVNGIFLTMAEAHEGQAHEDEKVFFENLLSGKSIK